MIELRKAIQQHLKSVHPRVYFQRAPDDAAFPYLVYDIPSLRDDGEGHQQLTLDVDGWDAPAAGDTTALETLMANMNAHINKAILDTDTSAVVFYLESKLLLDDDDPRIKRRKYIYQGRLFERSD